jgi:hypothetical protein
MGKPEPKADRRLLGTWKSDRRRSFRNIRPKPGCRPAALRKLKALFGKLVVRWGRVKYYTDLDGFRSSARYEVVARDSTSVVVRYLDSEGGEGRLQQIHFEGDHYWIALGGGLCEYFRRVGK